MTGSCSEPEGPGWIYNPPDDDGAFTTCPELLFRYQDRDWCGGSHVAPGSTAELHCGWTACEEQ
jgi:hypothetical protein